VELLQDYFDLIKSKVVTTLVRICKQAELSANKVNAIFCLGEFSINFEKYSNRAFSFVKVDIQVPCIIVKPDVCFISSPANLS